MTLQSLENMKKRVGYFGDSTSADQWTRMREDKLKSLKKALRYSYQAAIVQPFNSDVQAVTAIITYLQEKKDLTESMLNNLAEFKKEYQELADIIEAYGLYSDETINVLHQIISDKGGNYFRCLINHDKLKVDYEDKILSIPFEENSVTIDPVLDNDDLLQTNFHNGTVFKWIHGNKEEWVPDTYWIVYMQYSEETAYFRGEIRKADEEISIIVINPDGSESEKTYRGWMTGPNEEEAMWNVKKGVVWNDMNYTKLLYITKDEDTLAFFQRFDRIVINGKPWEVQAYNDSYGNNSSTSDSGIIRVALKETYTSTDQTIKEMKEDAAAQTDGIIGPDTLSPYDNVVYTGLPEGREWTVEAPAQGLIDYSIDDENKLHIEVLTTKAYRKGFDICYGDSKRHITIKSL